MDFTESLDQMESFGHLEDTIMERRVESSGREWKEMLTCMENLMIKTNLMETQYCISIQIFALLLEEITTMEN